ncbi:MAG: hypothetical protein JNL53_07450 [Cyclobacteriaceae bacterium]|nr:hypothetical protein [Cyclobacteriaceae bacterium]
MKLTLNIACLACLIFFASCEHNVSMETTVHEDGTLDKIMILEVEDTTRNFLGISPQAGWQMKIQSINNSANEASKENKKWRVTYQKHFATAEEANEMFSKESDSLFRISSRFQKKFKWFYTYIYYSDTYHKINRMALPPDDYIAKEDYDFINRLPAEGSMISKADSLYLAELHKKIFDVYGLRALFEMYYSLNEQLITESGLEKHWLDTLQNHKPSLFESIANNQNLPDDYLYRAMDSLGIPFPYERLQSRYETLFGELEAKLNFINHASEGNYTHVINMPWNIVQTNADSISDRRAQWNPPSIKFLLRDYTLYAEARKANYWAFAVSAVILIFTIYLFLRRKDSPELR